MILLCIQAKKKQNLNNMSVESEERGRGKKWMSEEKEKGKDKRNEERGKKIKVFYRKK